jgi:uncharacterized protein (DUF2236 family)
MIGIRNEVLAAAGLLIGAIPTAASAQLEATAARRAACMGDAVMLCSSAIPNKARIVQVDLTLRVLRQGSNPEQRSHAS